MSYLQQKEQRDEKWGHKKKYLSFATKIKLWRERESKEKRTCITDCAGWKEPWNRNSVLFTVHAVFRETGLLMSSFNNQPCTKHPSPAPVSLPNANNPQGVQYCLTAAVAFIKDNNNNKKCCFLSEENKGKAAGFYLVPITTQWQAEVSWALRSPPRSWWEQKQPWPLLQLTPDLHQGKKKQHARAWG